MDPIKSNFLFFREFLQEFEATGSFCPTSKWAAMAMTEPLVGTREAKKILEVGPGTGSVTVKILDRMQEQDELCICEINPRFMASLKESLPKHPRYDELKDRITFFEGPIQDYPGDDASGSGSFDVIVCAIPFLNMDIGVVKDIFDKFRRLAKPGCVLTYYEYIGLREVGKAVSIKRRRRVEDLENFFADVKSNCGFERTRVWRNVLPINVYKLQNLAA